MPIPDHEHHSPDDWRHCYTSAFSLDSASADRLRQTTAEAAPTVLIVGSLYLAGEVLAANGEAPD